MLSLRTLFCASLFAATPALADDLAAQADQALQQTKPALGESGDAAAAKCQALSDQARARGAKVLVIGFEGLASFSEASTIQAYRYHWELTHHLTATPPGPALAGFVVNGTLAPLIARFKGAMEVLAFPFSAQSDAAGSTPERCALLWMKVPGRHLVVIGHSFGGDAAVQLMNNLAARNVMVDFTLTLDPVPKTPRPSSVISVTRNTHRWENYYQRNIPPMGVSLDSAAVNMQLHVGHIMVPSQPQVVQTAIAHVAPLVQ